jgi:hypothetical protein
MELHEIIPIRGRQDQARLAVRIAHGVVVQMVPARDMGRFPEWA